RRDRVWADVQDLVNMPLRFDLGISLPFSSKLFRRKFAEDESALLALHGPLTRNENVAGQIGGYSFQAEVDLYRQLAFRELGHESYVYSDHWDSVEELDERADNPPFFATSPEKRKAWTKTFREKRPGLKWILAHEDQIIAAANTWQLLFMFRPNIKIGLSF